ncbi:RNA-binding protein 8A [Entophlyctis sp. JEL0112]|nr:RNA-binding protein 8A [Entophlyctis sp. JEL0112]
MSNLVDLEPGADDLTAAMVVDEEGDSSAALKQGATRRRGRGFEGLKGPRDGGVTGRERFDAIDGRAVEGWIILVTGVHEEASEDDIKERFADFGEIKNLHLNLDRRSGFVKGYCLLEYNSYKEAKAAIDETNGTELLGQKIYSDFAFVTGAPTRSHYRRSRR